MDAQPEEKVGVIVIHGVGETYEGWIDTYLIPDLEKWSAYDSVKGLARKDKDNDLVLSVRADDRHVAVALGNDEDFRKFCQVAGLDPLADSDKFKTRGARLKNRDELRYYIKSVFDLKKANEWLALLRKEGVPSTLAFNPVSEVYRVRDPGSSDSTSTWQSFTRRCPLDGREVTISELYWADMSKGGDTNFSRLSAAIQLFLESPHVLGGAFLKGSEKGVHALISWLIRTSNWFMRWPIAGLSVTVFTLAFAVMALQQMDAIQWFHQTIAGCLAAIIIAGTYLFKKWEHRKVGLADLALSSAECAFFLLALLAAAVFFYPGALTAPPERYLFAGVAILLLAWTIWTFLNVFAIILVSSIAFARLFTGPKSPPLARPAAAISLTVLLGIIWKFVLAVLGALVISVLVKDVPPLKVACTPATEASTNCIVATAKAALANAGVANTVALFSVALAVIVVLGWRSARVRLFGTRAADGSLTMPRLIASPLIVVTLFAGAMINAFLAYSPELAVLQIPLQIRDMVAESWGKAVGTGTLGLVVFFFLVRRLLEKSNSVVHIGRDLVDHQYNRGARPSWRRSKSRRGRLEKAAPNTNFLQYRRRQRIQGRLEALIDEVIAEQNFDRLIFLTHSQGTVILHDYLVNHDNLIPKSHEDKKSLFDVKEIDVITLGSPLTHIYRYYFQDYDQITPLSGGQPPLIDRVKTWTNMWRVDDPIGHPVDLLEIVENKGLGPGGHEYYWKEDAVCGKLWELVLKDIAAPAPETRAATATSPAAVAAPTGLASSTAAPPAQAAEAPAPRPAETVNAARSSQPDAATEASKPTAQPAQPAASPRLDESGRVDLGHLEPVAPAVELPAELSTKIKSAEEVLSLDRINTVPGWNPFLTGNDEAKRFGPLVGPYHRAADLFESKTIVPVKEVFAGFLKSLPSAEAAAALQPLVDALPPVSLLRTPAHQFNVAGKTDTRVVFFGGAEPNNQIDVDALVAELGQRHMRVIIQWAHMSKPALSMSTQGGTPQDILGNTYMPAGSSHINAFSTGWLEGKPVTVTTNWGDQSVLGDEWPDFAVHLLAIDYQAGARDPIPEETLAAYKRNADMWDCFSAVIVPFTGEDPFGLTEYTQNPLEVHDQPTTRAVAGELANLDWATFSSKYGAFYCAEAQYSVANFGPQEDEAGGTLLKQSRFGATPLGRVIRTFGEAPGYVGKPIEWCRQYPEIGWRWLLERGPESGGISLAGYKKLAIKLYPDAGAGETEDGFCRRTYSNRQGVFLEFIPEHIKGWQAYRPSNRDGLIASPLTAATTAWSLLRLYMPREGIARTLVEDLLRAYASGSEAVKTAATLLAGGQDPNSPAGRQALGGLGMQLATGFMLAALTDGSGLEPSDREHYDSTAQKRILSNAGYEQITNDTDKAKVKEIWRSFLAVLGDPQNAAQDRMDAALLDLDRRAAAVEVERRAPKGQILRGLMRFVPPGSWAMWAQQPFLNEAYAVRYAATGIHKSLAKD